MTESRETTRSTSEESDMENNLTPEMRESIERGLADSAAGRVTDLGSFEQYADEPDDDDA